MHGGHHDLFLPCLQGGDTIKGRRGKRLFILTAWIAGYLVLPIIDLSKGFKKYLLIYHLLVKFLPQNIYWARRRVLADKWVMEISKVRLKRG